MESKILLITLNSLFWGSASYMKDPCSQICFGTFYSVLTKHTGAPFHCCERPARKLSIKAESRTKLTSNFLFLKFCFGIGSKQNRNILIKPSIFVIIITVSLSGNKNVTQAHFALWSTVWFLYKEQSITDCFWIWSGRDGMLSVQSGAFSKLLTGTN